MAKIKAFIVVNNTAFNRLPDALQVVDGGNTLVGGYSWVGKVATWHGLLVVTTDAQLTAFDNAAGNACVALVRMSDEGRIELDNDMDSAVLTKLNNWLTARGYQTENAASNRQIIRRLFRRFLDIFDFDQVDIN